jgi:4-aminobutyrate aminotransferase/(S)-3-amino-2-methylpropionate transaminase
MGMALTGKVVPYKAGFGPFPGEIFQALFPNAYMGIDTEQAIASIRTLFSSVVAPDRIAAFIVEPVQGEGGFVPAPAKFLAELRAIADQYGILLIVDEIQTGMARTGAMFALDRHGIKADIITLAKGLAGGFPLSAVVGRADLMDAVAPGGLGGTYAGNPLAVAAAHAVLDAIAQEDLCSRAVSMGERISDRLCDIARRPGFEFIGDVRGPGAMVAFELVKDRYSRDAAPELAQACVAEAERRGLLILLCGTRFNVIRLLPPLTLPDALLAEGLDMLEDAMEAVARRFVTDGEEAGHAAV